MIEVSGAVWSDELSEDNDFLVANSVYTKKCKLAQRFKVPIRNFHWLQKIYMGQLRKEEIYSNSPIYETIYEDTFPFDISSIKLFLSKLKVQ